MFSLGMHQAPHDDVHRLLGDHHRDVERSCLDLLSECYADDSLALIAAWRRFEGRMLAHMAAEEELVLDEYAREHADDARVIRDQHDQLRSLLTPLSIEVELHVIRATTVERMVAALRGHAAHEDASMYPWAERHLSAHARTQLAARLS